MRTWPSSMRSAFGLVLVVLLLFVPHALAQNQPGGGKQQENPAASRAEFYRGCHACKAVHLVPRVELVSEDAAAIERIEQRLEQNRALWESIWAILQEIAAALSIQN